LQPLSTSSSDIAAEWARLHAEHGTGKAGMPAIHAAISRMQDPFRRNGLEAALIAEWAAVDPAGALLFLLQTPGRDEDYFAREWMRRDPQAAAAALIHGGAETQELLQSMLSEIADMAPDQLTTAVGALPEPDSAWATAASHAFATFFRKDPAAARAAAESLTGPRRAHALAGVASAWAESDGPAALAWAQRLGAGERKGDCPEGCARRLGQDRPGYRFGPNASRSTERL
jgi:hypothetical protein